MRVNIKMDWIKSLFGVKVYRLHNKKLLRREGNYVLNCISPKRSVGVLTSRTSECHFIGRQVFTEIIKLKWGHQSECSPPGPVSLQKEEMSKQAQEENHVRMKTNHSMLPQAEECQRLAADHQKHERPGTDFLSALGRTNPTDLLIPTSNTKTGGLSNPVCGTLLQQPLQMTTEVFSVKFPMWWEF